MRKERCGVCGGPTGEHPTGVSTEEYSLNFSADVCKSCSETLARGFAGIVEMLRGSHEEHRERVLFTLMERLEEQGFSTEDFLSRRTA